MQIDPHPPGRDPLLIGPPAAMVLQRAEHRPGRALIQSLAVDPGRDLIPDRERQRAKLGIVLREDPRKSRLELLIRRLTTVGVAFRHGGRF